jgi:hypothetical protein
LQTKAAGQSASTCDATTGWQSTHDDSGVTARHEFHQRAYFVAHRHLREANGPCKLGDPRLVRRIAIGVHQHDGASANTVIKRGPQRFLGSGEIQRAHGLAMCAEALVDLDHTLIEHRRQLDPAHEKLGPVLISDTQRVAKTARDGQHRALAGALQQCVGRDRGTHLDRLDRSFRDQQPGARPAARESREPRHRWRARISERFVSRAFQTARATISVQVPQRVDPEEPPWNVGVGHRLSSIDAEGPRRLWQNDRGSRCVKTSSGFNVKAKRAASA